MYAKTKRLLAVVLTVCLVMGFIPVSAGASGITLPTDSSGQIHKTDGQTSYYPVTPDGVGAVTTDPNQTITTPQLPGVSVEMSKTIAPTTTENEFDITLKVETNEAITPHLQPVDAAVVLAIDLSNSMADDNRLTDTKNAAKAFINDYYTNEANVKRALAIVVFGGHAETKLHWIDIAGNSTTNRDAALAIIEGLQVRNGRSDTSPNGSTNIEAGLQLAYNLINPASNDNKVLHKAHRNAFAGITNVHVVLMTDGGPTRRGYTSSSTDAVMLPTNTNANGYSNTYGNGSRAIVANAKAADAVATTIKNLRFGSGSGAKAPVMHTIAFAQSGQTLYDYAEGYGTSDKKMLLTDWLATKVATSNQHAKIADSSNLLDAFIAVQGSVTISSKAWHVLDPMGENIELVGAWATPTQMSIAKSDGTFEGFGTYLTYEDGKLDWDLDAMNKGIVNGKYTYELTYRIRLTSTDTAYYLTNGATSLEYVFQKDGNKIDEGTAYFRVPKVRANFANLTFTKQYEGTTVGANEAAFELYRHVSGTTWAKVGTEQFTDSSGQITFNNLPKGSYKLVETKHPVNAVEAVTDYHFKVSYGHIVAESNTDLMADGSRNLGNDDWKLDGSTYILNNRKSFVAVNLEIPVIKTIGTPTSLYSTRPAQTFNFKLSQVSAVGDTTGTEKGQIAITVGADAALGTNKFTLTGVEFTQGATVVYMIKETGSATNWDFDASAWYVSVSLDGETPVYTYYKDGTAQTGATAATFENVYTHVPTGQATFSKTWSNNHVAANEVKLTLTNNVTAVTQDVVLNTTNGWTSTITGLTLGQEYTWIEQDFGDSGYTMQSGTFTLNGNHISTAYPVAVTNTLNTATGSITVSKIWSGDADSDRTSDEVVVSLYTAATGGTLVASQTTVKGVATFSGLTLGQTYYVEETIDAGLAPYYGLYVDGQLVSGRVPVTVGVAQADRSQEVTLDNRYTEPVGSLTITKAWKDENDANQGRPGSIDVEVTYAGTGTLPSGWENNMITVTLKASESWTATLSNLPRGSYSLDEVEADYLKIYQVAYSAKEVSVSKGALHPAVTITNTDPNASGKGTITVTKAWVDTKNTFMRPQSIMVQLYKDGTAVEGVVVELNNSNSWTYTFEVDLNATYSVRETNTGEYAEYYNVTYTENVRLDAYTRSGGITITNTWTELPTGSITVQKQWANTENDPDFVLATAQVNINLMGTFNGQAPEEVANPGDAPAEPAISNPEDEGYDAEEWATYYALKAQYDIDKAAYDLYEVQLAEYESKADVKLYTTLTGNGSYTFEDLPLNYTYTVTEDAVPYYTTTYSVTGDIVLTSGNKTKDVTVTNTFDNSNNGVSLTVYKGFSGNAQPLGGHSGAWSFDLYKDSVKVGSYTTTANKYEFTGLGFGSYHVVETTTGANYTWLGNVLGESTTDPKAAADVVFAASRSNNAGEITMVNLYTVPTASIVINKAWVDDNYEFVRPASLSFTLTRGVANEEGTVVFDTVWSDRAGPLTVNEDGFDETEAWTYTFSGLPVYDNDGNTYVYKVSESGYNASFYTATYADGTTDVVDGFEHSENGKTITVTNTAEVKGTVTVTKSWSGFEGHQSLIKPVEVQLYANDEAVEGKKATLSGESNPAWSATWSQLPVYDNNDELIAYSVKEITTSQHWTTVASNPATLDNANAAVTLTLTNTFVPYDDGGLDVVKTGNSANLIDGEAVLKYTITLKNNSNKTMGNLKLIDTPDKGGVISNLKIGGVNSDLLFKDNEDGTYTLELTGYTLAAGATLLVTYDLTVTETGDYKNLVNAYATVEGEEELEDEDDATVTVKEPGLSIVKSVDHATIEMTGSSVTLTYTIIVTNFGTVDLTGVVVKDLMVMAPSGANLVYNFGETSYTQDTDTGEYEVVIGDLPASTGDGDTSNTKTFTYTVTVDTAGSYVNNVVVNGYTAEQEELTDESSANVTVTTPDPDEPDPDDPDPDDPDPIEPTTTEPEEEELNTTDPAGSLEEEPEEEEEIEFLDPTGSLPATGVLTTPVDPVWTLGVLAVLASMGIAARQMRKKEEQE